jgi:hypothetical protein
VIFGTPCILTRIMSSIEIQSRDAPVPVMTGTQSFWDTQSHWVKSATRHPTSSLVGWVSVGHQTDWCPVLTGCQVWLGPSLTGLVHPYTILEVLINIDLDEDIEIKNKILIQYFSSYITSFIL